MFGPADATDAKLWPLGPSGGPNMKLGAYAGGTPSYRVIDLSNVAKWGGIGGMVSRGLCLREWRLWRIRSAHKISHSRDTNAWAAVHLALCAPCIVTLLRLPACPPWLSPGDPPRRCGRARAAAMIATAGLACQMVSNTSRRRLVPCPCHAFCPCFGRGM